MSTNGINSINGNRAPYQPKAADENSAIVDELEEIKEELKISNNNKNGITESDTNWKIVKSADQVQKESVTNYLASIQRKLNII